MGARPYEAVDWTRPWLTHLLPIARLVIKAADWRQALNDKADEMGLRNHRGLPVRFVEEIEAQRGQPYETLISNSGCVPTRDNLHDFFNALVWLTYPKRKFSSMHCKRQNWPKLQRRSMRERTSQVVVRQAMRQPFLMKTQPF